MPRTVEEAFDVLVERLKPTEAETNAAKSHRESIDACLRSKFGMTSMFRSGSFGHGTSVSGYSDIDYFAVIPSNNLSDTSDYSLQKLKDALKERFPSTAGIAVSSPVVMVPFGGGAVGERHEIAPAYANGSKNGFSVYGIPNRANGWMNASPTAHNAWVNGINDKLDKKVKQLIRLVKYWNYLNGGEIRSFYLELRTTEFAYTQSSILYRYDVKSVFSALVNKGLAAMQDPQGISGLVYPCTDAVKPSALSKATTAQTRAQKAMDAESAGNMDDAFYWWNMVFNSKFPSR
jgi:Second Messenger Oligonucleotide or Dinucleotide Synthetase domain